jgi:C4-dicarboxylate transporter DctQ subunit
VLINRLDEKMRGKFIIFGLCAGVLFTGIVAYLATSFVWDNGAHHAWYKWLGMSVEGSPEGPTSPDLEWPTWMVYSAVPLGTSLMCFRFLQVMVSFIKTGELPHHDHGHVDGLEEELAVPVDFDPYAMKDNLHPDETPDQKGGTK